MFEMIGYFAVAIIIVALVSWGVAIVQWHVIEQHLLPKHNKEEDDKDND